MPTWVSEVCRRGHFNYITATSASATVDALLDGDGWTRSAASIGFSADGPYGSRYIALTHGASLTRGLGATYSEICFSFYYKRTLDSNEDIFYTLSGANVEFNLRTNSSGNLRFFLGGSLIETSTNTFPLNTDIKIDIHLKIHATTGIVKVNANGVSFINFSGDTEATSATVDAFKIWGWSSNVTYYANFVAYTTPADFPLPDGAFFTFHPDADGAMTDWTASAGNRFETVDEVQPNSDTDYIESSTPTNISTFSMGAVADKTPQFLLNEGWIRKTDAGDRSIKLVVRQGTTNYSGPEHVITGSYARYVDLHTVDLASSVAWTPTLINAAEFGVNDFA